MYYNNSKDKYLTSALISYFTANFPLFQANVGLQREANAVKMRNRQRKKNEHIL
jgi:hypothetical protein